MNDTKDTPNIDAVIAFLLGEAPLHGVWFGEQHPTEPGRFWWRWPLRSVRAQMERTAFARQSAQQVASVPTRDEIRAIFLANGFTLKDNDDLRPYVYDAAYALIQRVLETPPISAAQPSNQPAQQEQDRIDAERYRWLRDNLGSGSEVLVRVDGERTPIWKNPETLDASIDEARKGGSNG